jgi:hypothetical protein
VSYREALKMIDWRKGAFGFEKQALYMPATARCRLSSRRLNEKALSISEQPIAESDGLALR